MKHCSSCLSLQHFTNECPILYPNFNTIKIIQDYKSEIFNERIKCPRKTKKTCNARAFHKTTREKTDYFQKLDLYSLSSSLSNFDILIFLFFLNR